MRHLLIPCLLVIVFHAAPSRAACTIPSSVLKAGSHELIGSCSYNVAIKITEPNTALNCNGATLDGEGKLGTGILVDSQGKDLSNISITNCKIQNYKNTGIGIGWAIPDYQKTNGQHPKSVNIESVHISGILGVGIYIDDHTSGVTIKDSSVKNVRGAGIYIEHDSEKSTIINSLFVENGWNEKGHPTQPAIAIDASENNTISGNKFFGNGLAGVALYRNCDEDWESGHSVKRVHGANKNLIINNTFKNEIVGIWVASRQSRDLRFMKCGRPPYKIDSNGAVFVEDEAIENTIANNKIESSKKAGIIVEMGPNEISGNNIKDSHTDDILTGSAIYSRATGNKAKAIKLPNNVAKIKSQE
ncbi:right-handed parallel beta-helix repeat-containing protein [Chitinilyticum piscinae]|uniref:Right-handed parallel beta-helix repeat-containing protein n=1 Tax=Chitinilyticum piscinae TaxID=2866724 RepID=A0A8J7K0D2_9NEIS|nr:right-handed parallel beta-helix repeat-containing protein [Chitinilyticum piscinae]MBE9607841.1 right-handed parallel beta-helix repeat-containing protein [Chitinilyticum piscinae]